MTRQVLYNDPQTESRLSISEKRGADMLGKWLFIIAASAAILIYINWDKILPAVEPLLR